MSEKSFLFVTGTVNPEGKEALGQYLAGAGPLFQAGGGTPFGRFQLTDQIAGNAKANVSAIMEFPSADAIKEIFDSAAYQELIPLRNQAFSEIDIYIAQS